MRSYLYTKKADGKWHKRFCETEGTFLKVFKPKDQDKILQIICLPQAKSVNIEAENETNKSTTRFDIVMEDKVISFKSNMTDELESWVTCLTEMMKLPLPSSLPTTPMPPSLDCLGIENNSNDKENDKNFNIVSDADHSKKRVTFGMSEMKSVSSKLQVAVQTCGISLSNDINQCNMTENQVSIELNQSTTVIESEKPELVESISVNTCTYPLHSEIDINKVICGSNSLNIENFDEQHKKKGVNLFKNTLMGGLTAIFWSLVIFRLYSGLNTKSLIELHNVYPSNEECIYQSYGFLDLEYCPIQLKESSTNDAVLDNNLVNQENNQLHDEFAPSVIGNAVVESSIASVETATATVENLSTQLEIYEIPANELTLPEKCESKPLRRIVIEVKIDDNRKFKALRPMKFKLTHIFKVAFFPLKVFGLIFKQISKLFLKRI